MQKSRKRSARILPSWLASTLQKDAMSAACFFERPLILAFAALVDSSILCCGAAEADGNSSCDSNCVPFPRMSHLWASAAHASILAIAVWLKQRERHDVIICLKRVIARLSANVHVWGGLKFLHKQKGRLLLQSPSVYVQLIGAGHKRKRERQQILVRSTLVMSAVALCWCQYVLASGSVPG